MKVVLEDGIRIYTCRITKIAMDKGCPLLIAEPMVATIVHGFIYRTNGCNNSIWFY